MNIHALIAAEGYTIVKEFEAGGMAHVFLAEDPCGEPCVVKTPRQDMLPAKSRFYDEARLGMLVRHQNLAETLHFFDVGERPFLVVEYIDGESLSEHMRKKTLSHRKAIQVAVDILEVLSVLHNAKTHDGAALHAVHRDVTPNNIILEKNGTAKLIDLGICSFATRVTSRTQTGAVCGTLRFIAPELWSGGSFSPSSDVWSLGMCLLEALTGEKVISGSYANVVHTLLKGDYLDAALQKLAAKNVPQPLLSLLKEMLASNPHARPTTAKLCAKRFIQLQKVYGVENQKTQKEQEVDDVLAAFLGVSPQQKTAQNIDQEASKLESFASLPSAKAELLLDEKDRTDLYEYEKPSAAPPHILKAQTLADRTEEVCLDAIVEEKDDLRVHDNSIENASEQTSILKDTRSLMDLLDAEEQIHSANHNREQSLLDESSFADIAEELAADSSAPVKKKTQKAPEQKGIADLLEPGSALHSRAEFSFAEPPTTDIRHIEAQLQEGAVELSLQERNLLYNDMFRALALGLSKTNLQIPPLEEEMPASPSGQSIQNYVANLRTLERPSKTAAEILHTMEPAQKAATGIFKRLEQGMPLFPWEASALQKMPKAQNEDTGAAPIEWLIPETLF